MAELDLGLVVGEKGEKGDKGNDGAAGATGATGAAAGFGTVTATVDDGTGTPSVAVTATGEDTAKNFAFAFHNLKGEKGDTTEIQEQLDTLNDLVAAAQSTADTAVTNAAAAQETADSKWSAVDGTTSQKGIVKLSTATNSTSTTLAATPSAVKAAYDLAATANSAASSAASAASAAQSTADTANNAAATAQDAVDALRDDIDARLNTVILDHTIYLSNLFNVADHTLTFQPS